MPSPASSRSPRRQPSRRSVREWRAGSETSFSPCPCRGACRTVVSPERVALAYDSIGSQRKQYREFASRHGDHADYGHVELIFGHHAPEEVFPAISGWIERELVDRST